VYIVLRGIPICTHSSHILSILEKIQPLLLDHSSAVRSLIHDLPPYYLTVFIYSIMGVGNESRGFLDGAPNVLKFGGI
jgi:hypothetical protein